MEASYTSTIGDDFDVYFKRAAQLQLQPQLHHLTTPAHQHRRHHDQQQQQAGVGVGVGVGVGPGWRRDSAPHDRRSSSTERRRVGASGSIRHKRTSSCRYPQHRPTISVTHDVTVTRVTSHDVTVTRDQSVSPSEQTPLTAGSHHARLNQHRQLGQ